SNEDGFYRIVGLAPGKYVLTVEKAGYKKSVLENVSVGAEAVQGLNVVLQAGEVTASVTVTDEATEQLETENGNVAKGITSAEIKRLPQVGRDPYELARLTPGIFGDGARSGNGNAAGLPNAGSDTGPGASNNSIFQAENQPQISANGQRISANNFQIDGVSVNSLTHGGAAVITPNQESVKEVQITSSSYSAEDGRNSGAQIKVVSQNGTNEFHGSAFFKYNSPKLNAFNKYPNDFGRGMTERVERFFRQFGGSLGGPLPLPRFGEGGPSMIGGKDKSFFFFSYEGLRETSTIPAVKYVETAQFRQSVLSARAGGVTAAILGSAGVAPRIGAVLTPSCADVNGPCQVVGNGLDVGSLSGGLRQYLTFGTLAEGPLDGIPDLQKALIAAPTTNKPNQYNARFDFYPTSNDQIAFSTYMTRSFFIGSDVGAAARPQADITSTPHNTTFTALYNKTISASLLNEARFNFTRFAFNEVESSSETNFGIPRIEIQDLLKSDRIKFGANQAETTPGIFSESTLEFRDVVSNVRGNHALKVGGDFRRELNNDNLNGMSRPLYTFQGLFNYANDAPIFLQINADPRTGGVADAQRHFISGGYGLFVQDDWKARPNLTLNMGLRYEYFNVLKERDDKVANFVFGPGGGLAGSKVVPTNELYKPDRNNFAPRLGFAYSPKYFGLENKLVLRGGFGVSYNRIPTVVFANTRGNPPFFARFTICCGTSPTGFSSPFAGGQILYSLGASNSPFSYPANPALALGINPATGAPPNGGVEIYGALADTPTAYVYSYSFEGQYALPHNLTAEVGYQGSSSHKLIRLVNQRFVQPVIPDNYFARAVFIPTPDVNANYNALNARLSRRFSQGYQFDAIYRWAKSIDTLSNEGPGAVTNQTFPQDLSQERGPSDYDVRHTFTLSGLWDLPIFRNRKDGLGKALGGWQINGILTKHTGFPWTPHTGQCVQSANSQDFVCPSRPTRYFGGALDDTSNEAFTRPGGNFPGGGLVYFDPNNPGGRLPPGIGRNSFRGPKYFAVDLSIAKRTGLPSAFHLNEAAFFEVKANFFNTFNNTNLAPFGFFSPEIDSRDFGRAKNALAGRVVELQGRLSF
ncbi:MAG TPA: TonB-dependent receptor, partial [Pyrinomonadaceae bacterium]|nr:TonB-dependent receptor [Pyrinomonadaceae bacterium]